MRPSRREFIAGALASGMAGVTHGEEPVKLSSVSSAFTLDRQTAVLAHPGIQRPVRFTVVTDSHFTLLDERDGEFRENVRRACQWPGMEKDLDSALEAARKWGSEVVMLTGDILSFPSFANVEFIARKMKACGLKWVYIAGNHDWHFEGLPGSDDEHRSEWIRRLTPLYQKRDPFVSSYVFGGVRFVSLDNSTYHITKDQLDFFRAELASGDPICLFMHIPFFMPLRPSLYTLGNPTWGAATDNYWEIERRQRWSESGQGQEAFELRRLAFSSANLVGVFAGHEHFLQIGSENGVPQFIVPKNHDGGAYMNVELRAM